MKRPNNSQHAQRDSLGALSVLRQLTRRLQPGDEGSSRKLPRHPPGRRHVHRAIRALGRKVVVYGPQTLQ